MVPSSWLQIDPALHIANIGGPKDKRFYFFLLSLAKEKNKNKKQSACHEQGTPLLLIASHEKLEGAQMNSILRIGSDLNHIFIYFLTLLFTHNLV